MLLRVVTGPKCDEQLLSRNVQEREDSGYISSVGGFFIGILVIAIAFAAWMYHRHSVANLKMEIAHHVQYTADPVTPSGR